MKKAVIFLNGDPPRKSEIKCEELTDSLKICADGAYRYVKKICVPDVVLGDFDSIAAEKIDKRCRIIRFKPEKDFTDGHLALQYALDEGATEIVIYGALGGRPDMAYANLSLLYQAKTGGAKAEIRGGGYTVTLENGAFEKSVNKGACVSMAPFFEGAHIISTKGLKYPMKNVTLNRLHISLSVSNVALADSFAVESEGELLLFTENIQRRTGK